MSLTSTLFDKNAYRAKLLRSTDEFRHTVNELYPSVPTCRADFLNGYQSKHSDPGLVDTESDLYQLDSILSDDPYYQYPKVNNNHPHLSRKECGYFPSEQHTKLYYYYPLSELSYNRIDHMSTYMHPIHSNNYIGANTKEDGRFTSIYKTSH